MELSKKCRRYLWKLAIRKFNGNEYLFRRVNIFEPGDLVHQFLADNWSLIQDKDEPLIFEDFKQFIIQQIRDAKALDYRAREYTFTDQIRPGEEKDLSVNPNVLSQDEKLDAYLFHQGGYRQLDEEHFREGSYRNPFTKELNYEAMVWDMKRAMCSWDRFWKCANNYEYYRLKNRERKTRSFMDIQRWNIEDPWLHAFIGFTFWHLPPGTRRVACYALDDSREWTQAEIAADLGLNQSTVSRHLNHVGVQGLKIIKKRYGKHAYFPGVLHVSV